jgi:hypothetical protein
MPAGPGQGGLDELCTGRAITGDQINPLWNTSFLGQNGTEMVTCYGNSAQLSRIRGQEVWEQKVGGKSMGV